MQKLTLLLLFTFLGHLSFGQQHLPTINASSTSVDIRVGNDYFSKGGWILDPQHKPDVFSIGSKWPYDSKKVTFITNVDSISFDVQPGRKYDFIILLNQHTPCHIQIATLSNPRFMNAEIVAIILGGFAVLLIVVFILRNRVYAKHLLHIGYAVPLLFWLVVFISGYMHGNYDHLKNVISELGAIETKPEVFTSTLFVLIAYLSTLFSVGFYRASKTLQLSRIPAILSFSKPISLTWVAIFPLGNEFHNMAGPLPFLTILGSLAAFLLWKKEGDFLKVRYASLLCFIIMLLIFTRFIRPFGINYEGLVQRFFYFGWTIWTIALTYFLSKKLRENKSDKHKRTIKHL